MKANQRVILKKIVHGTHHDPIIRLKEPLALPLTRPLSPVLPTPPSPHCSPGHQATVSQSHLLPMHSLCPQLVPSATNAIPLPALALSIINPCTQGTVKHLLAPQHTCLQSQALSSPSPNTFPSFLSLNSLFQPY